MTETERLNDISTE